MNARRVVITGVGVRCAGAADATQFWDNIRAGRSTVVPVTGIHIGDSECRVGGQVTDLDDDGTEEDYRVTRLLRAAMRDALSKSGFCEGPAELDRTRTGLAIGYCQFPSAGPRLSELMCSNVARVAAEHGFSGPRIALSTACSSGSAALAVGAERICAGEADVMFCGGADELLGASWLGFTYLQALSSTGTSAPYSQSTGLLLGEGAAIIVLEAEEHAVKRGAAPLADLAGWGSSADAYHITTPDPSGRGAVLAMSRALDRAGLTADDVDYVCGHGTGTKANDTMEIKAHRAVFGSRAAAVPLSSIKPMIGHTLGAAGAIEAAACVFALQDQLLPPTINFSPARPPDLDFVPDRSRPAEIDVVMSNNYAFGGDNMSVILTRPGRCRPAAPPVAREVCITGVGAAGPIGIGYDQWRDALLAGKSGIAPVRQLGPDSLGIQLAGELPELSARGVTTPAYWRQLDPLSRLALSVVRQAWDDAKLRLTPGERNRTALVFATASGPMSAVTRFTDSITFANPNPAMFPNIVLTAAPGHICNALGLRGPRISFASGGVATVDAIAHAAMLVGRGEADYAIVVAAEELTRLQLMTPVPGRNYVADTRAVPFQLGSPGVNVGAAGVAFLIEPAEHARGRGAHSYGSVLGTAVSADAVTTIEAAAERDPKGNRWRDVLAKALRQAAVAPADVGYVAAAANGAIKLDSLETGVLSSVFGTSIPVSAPKSAVGETMGASAGVGVIACLAALEKGVAPPTADLTDPVGSHRVRHVLDMSVEITGTVAVANAVSVDGSYGAVVIGL
jgi:3-oxoacyl-[acyl-carrier-protein] synthase II